MNQAPSPGDPAERFAALREPLPPATRSAGTLRRLWIGGGVVLGLLLAYHEPLSEWMRLASRSTRYSHVLLLPFISAYLVWLERDRLPRGGGPGLLAGLIALAIGIASLALSPAAAAGELPGQTADRLAVRLFSLYSFLVAGGFLALGSGLMRAIAFPVVLLLFGLPLPTWIETGLEVFFQHTSAAVVAWAFSLSGIAFLREGLIFQLPGLTLEVAQECSGVNSSYVLFITALIAGHLFLRSPGRRLLLAAFVVPLAIARNAVRIVTIALLCVQVDPAMIHSWVHRKGGPLFFALSLVPFFILLAWLRKSEKAASKAGGPPSP